MLNKIGLKMIEDHSHKSTGLRGVEVADTNICLIEGDLGNLFYRGFNITDLAKVSTFEEVVYLLIYGDLPTPKKLEEFSSVLVSNREIPQELIDHLRGTSKNTPSMCVLQSSLALLAVFDPEIESESDDANRRIAVRIIAKLPTIVAAWERIRTNQEPIKPNKSLSHAANFLFMLKGREPSSEIARSFDIVLILHAEHSFNASTFTARVIASTGADLYASISGAIGSLSGKYHGGANPRVYANLLKIKEMSNVEDWVNEQFETGRRVMGMGHAVYKAMDPRAIILKEMAESLTRDTGGIAQWMLETSNKMVEITQREFKLRKGYDIYPNVDLYGASIYSAMEFPLELFVPIFTLSRVAGWTAHILEEKFPEVPEIKPVLYRPSADYIGRYCGPLGCEYVPLEERGSELENENLVKELVIREINNAIRDSLIPVALKTRHVHLSKEDFQKLFGMDSYFSKVRSLSRSGGSKCGVTVDLVGPKRSLYGVCVIEPFKKKSQIEISRSDGFALGINPPTRNSGDITGTPGIHIIGPKGAVQTKEGVICPARHIHMNPSDAEKLGVINNQVVAISFSGKRAGILDEIKVRIDPNHSLELHLDMDEGNALFLSNGDLGRIMLDLDRSVYSPFR